MCRAAPGHCFRRKNLHLGGGGSEAKRKFVYLKPASNFGPFDKFYFLPDSDVGGWVGQGWPGPQTTPPPPAQCTPPALR